MGRKKAPKRQSKALRRLSKRDRATSFGIFELACNSIGISMVDWYPDEVREPAVRMAAEMGAPLNLPGRWSFRPVTAADAAARAKPKPQPKKRKKRAKA